MLDNVPLKQYCWTEYKAGNLAAVIPIISKMFKKDGCNNIIKKRKPLPLSLNPYVGIIIMKREILCTLLDCQFFTRPASNNDSRK